MKHITIVGAGQIGATLAYRLLQANYAVRIIDAGGHRQAPRTHQQIPWGWCRGWSLQQDVRIGRIDMPFQTEKIYGPMLITSSDKTRIKGWQSWLQQNPTSDAHVLTPHQAYDQYALPFREDKHVFVCDSRDFLINYAKLNHEIWEYLRTHKNCQFIENVQIKTLDIAPHARTQSLITSDDKEIDVLHENIIISTGNQISNLRIRDVDRSYYNVNYGPIAHIELPYVCVNKPKVKYVALWNEKSSLQLIGQDAKVGCGLIGNLRSIKVQHLPYFINLARKGTVHSSLFPWAPEKTPEQLIADAITDLRPIHELEPTTRINTCTIDVTPTTTPIVKTLNNNTLIVGGFSGSCATAYTRWFGHAIVDTIQENKLHERLKYFNKMNIFQHLFPNADVKSYI